MLHRPRISEQGRLCLAATKAELPCCLLADMTLFWVQLHAPEGMRGAQAVVASARTLQDITDERVVPVDYLGVLILLFLLLVLDRLFYSLGLHLGKVRLPQPPCRLADAWQYCYMLRGTKMSRGT